MSLRTECHDFEVSTLLIPVWKQPSIACRGTTKSCVEIQRTHAVVQERCPQWASKGECGLNPNFMLRSCQKSCGLCGPGVDPVRTSPQPHLCVTQGCHAYMRCAACTTRLDNQALAFVLGYMPLKVDCFVAEWCSGSKCGNPAYYAHASPGCCADPACKGISER